MDEETRQAFAELKAAIAELSGTLTARMNDQHERLLNRLSRIDRETATTHEYLLEIVKSHGIRLRDIEGRLGDQS
jgi:hypothetical protein